MNEHDRRSRDPDRLRLRAGDIDDARQMNAEVYFPLTRSIIRLAEVKFNWGSVEACVQDSAAGSELLPWCLYAEGLESGRRIGDECAVVERPILALAPIAAWQSGQTARINEPEFNLQLAWVRLHPVPENLRTDNPHQQKRTVANAI